MKFEPIVANPDLDVHPDPPGHWAHVAVICRWKDAHAQRKPWPHVSVIGPLRTVRGLDELARNLLHNPQIRVVLVVGNDQTEGEETTEALLALWKGEPAGEKHIGEEVRGPFWDVQTLVQLVVGDLPTAPWRHLAQFPDLLPPWTYETKPPDYKPECAHFHGRYGCTNDWCGHGVEPGALRPASHPSPLAALVPSDYQSERPKVTLPPPPPAANATAPSGDPGERVVGETLADLWPQILHRAMRFGVQRPTHYGPTRELLCLVGVVRNVEKSVIELRPNPYDDSSIAQHRTKLIEWTLRDQFVDAGPMPEPEPTPEQRHPILGITWAQAEGYRKRISQAEVPEGAPYGYGSRMRGVGGAKADDALDMMAHSTMQMLDTLAGTAEKLSILRSALKSSGDPVVDQIEAVEKLLTEKPDTRAAYVTPWRPTEDSGKESGRPCMVSAWFRVVDDGEDEPSG